MKLNRSTIGYLLIGFFFSIFMGVTGISIGIGALYPPLNYIAKPLACPNGQLSYQQSVSNPVPGTTYTTAGWTCTDSKTGAQTTLDAIKMSVYAGPIYGILLFLIGCFFWYMNARWGSDPVIGKILNRVQGGIGILLLALIVGYFAVFPIVSVFVDEFVPTPTPPAADVTATAVEATYEALTQGQPVTFNSTATPLPNWNGIPIITQAVAGQQVNDHTYTFDVPADSGTIESFYTKTLESLGWNQVDSRWMGMQFTKDGQTLFVTLAPASDEQSFVVTFMLVQ